MKATKYVMAMFAAAGPAGSASRPQTHRTEILDNAANSSFDALNVAGRGLSVA